MGRGRITITFDDGYLNQYKNAFPIMETYGYRGVVFIITGLVGECFEGRRLMNLHHLNTLAAAGWEIGSHSVSHPHLPLLANTALERELRESKRWISNHGFSIASIAYPYGDFNDHVLDVTGTYYRYGRIFREGLNTLDKANTALRAIPLWEEIDSCIHWVEQAMEEEKWVIVVAHGVVASKNQLPPSNEVFGWTTTALFETFLRYLKTQGIPVTTFVEAQNTTFKEAADLP